MILLLLFSSILSVTCSFMSFILSVIIVFSFIFSVFWYCALCFFLCLFNYIISFLGFCLKIFSSSLILLCISSSQLSWFTWIVSFFNIPLICFFVNLFLYLLYPHLVIIMFFFCFSIAVTRLSFSSIAFWLEYVILPFSYLYALYFLFSPTIISVTVDKSLLFVRT